MKKPLIILWITLCGWSSLLFGQINEKRILSETNHQIYYATYSPDGKFIATTGSDNNIILWNTESGIVYRTLAGLKKRPNRVAFSLDGKTLFSAGEDGIITSWDPLLVQKFDSALGHRGPIKALDISPDGTLLASGGEDRILRIWRNSDGKLTLVYELKGHKRSITSVAFSPDGHTLVSGGADKTLMKWDVRSGTKTGSCKAHEGWIRCTSFSPDSRFIATGGDDNLVKIWNAADLSPYKTLEGHADWVQTLDFLASGQHIISGGHDHQIRIWSLETGEEVAHSMKLEHIVLSVDASPMRNEIISSCLLSEKLHFWAHGYGSAIRPEVGLTDVVRQEQEQEQGHGLGQEQEQELGRVQTQTSQQSTETVAEGPNITLFSPEPKNGEVIHDDPTILIIGKVDDPDGIQTMLVNRERVQISGAGVFQKDLELLSGENTVDLVAVSHAGKMTSTTIVIHCTDENAVRTASEKPPLTRGKYYALIIAVADYADEAITDLDYPIIDADGLYNTLVDHYSFSKENITYLKNPDRAKIIIAMDNLSRSVTPYDNLLIFYAGHGHWDEKSEIGYWLPGDAREDNTANWFRNSTLRDFIGSIQSRHTLLIADACFSGSIFKTRAAFATKTSGIQKLHELPSRKAMTSGNLKEEVPDKSVFVKYLIQELNNNEAAFIPSEELFGNFKTAVLNNSPNIPQYGIIQNVGDEGGDFIFRRK